MKFGAKITDPMGYNWTYAYYNDFASGSGAQTTTDFPNPIKRVYDPTVTLYTDPRNNQTPVGWNFWETYHWVPATACLDTYSDRQGNTTTLTYYTGSNLTNRGLIATKSIVNQGVTYTDTYNYYSTAGTAYEGKIGNHTDAYGTFTTYSYDNVTGALVLTALDPAGQNITKNYHYSAAGEIDEEWSGSDAHTYYSNFDTYGNAQTITPPGALASNYTFDDFNNKLTVTPPSPQGTTTMTYDYWDRLIRTTTPDANYTENTYNLDSNVTDVRMEDGSHRTTTYNFLDQPSTVTVPVDNVTANNLVTTTDYDYNGRRISLTAPDGPVTTFLYNERGDLVKTTYSDGTNRQWGYDGNKNVLWRQNGRGQLTYYGYDNLNRLLSIDYNSSGTPDVTFGYRKDGLRTSMTDGMGTSTWTYNNAKQLTGMYDAPTNKSLTYTYQAGTGRPTSTVAPGNTWSYFYDSQTRPWYTTQTMSGEIVRNSLFWDDGSVKKKLYPNNTKTEYGYDTRGRTTSIRHAVDSLDYTQEQLNYQYSNGNVSQYSLSINGGASYVTNYTHDLANRLLSEVRTDSSSANAYNKSYVYTKGNDRASTTKNSTSSTYTYFTNTNRFKTGEGFTVNTYDNDGNPTSITTPGGTWTLTYDEDSRLTQIVKSNGTTSFKYNGDGHRVERATPTSTYRYLLNGDNVVLTTTTSYNIQAYYTPGIGYFSGGQMHFYQENALGSALVVRDAAGNWESLTEYDAYGEEYDINGTQKSDFRFAGSHGYIKDDETGMELLGARYYLPVLGRFLNQDPIGLSGGLNLYAYCDNSPLQKLDPDGRQARDYASAYMNNLFKDTFKYENPYGMSDKKVWEQFYAWRSGTGPNSYWHNGYNDEIWWAFQDGGQYKRIVQYIKDQHYVGKGKGGVFEGGGIGTWTAFRDLASGDINNLAASAMGAVEWRAVPKGDHLNLVIWTKWGKNSFLLHMGTDIPRKGLGPYSPMSNVYHYFVYQIPIPKK